MEVTCRIATSDENVRCGRARVRQVKHVTSAGSTEFQAPRDSWRKLVLELGLPLQEFELLMPEFQRLLVC